MMGHREKLKNGDEVDALLRCKRFYNWRPGVRQSVKRKYHKRVRQMAKQDLPISTCDNGEDY